MTKYIIANWKANKNVLSIQSWFADFFAEIKQFQEKKLLETEADEAQILKIKNLKLKIIIAPAYPLLMAVDQQIKNLKLNISLASQDLSPFPAGAYTGAVSAFNLQGLNVAYSLLGHSERRRYFQETDLEVAKKVELAIEQQISPIICLDEEYLQSQAQLIDKKDYQQCLVAYEPLSAISTMPGAKDPDIKQVAAVIERIKSIFGSLTCIYGGSVDEFNINEYLMISDGVLVGGASLDGKLFARLIARLENFPSA